MSHHRWILMTVIAAGGILQLIGAPRVQAQVAIVVSKSNNIGDMSTEGVRKLFLGERSSWPNGRRVTVLMSAPGSSERTIILRHIYKMSESEYVRYTMQATFTGRVQSAPRELESLDMKRAVADNPGAIGYLPIADVDDSVHAVLMVR
jgi:ABC-type phosphate transport system substrate-binding protein